MTAHLFLQHAGSCIPASRGSSWCLSRTVEEALGGRTPERKARRDWIGGKCTSILWQDVQMMAKRQPGSPKKQSGLRETEEPVKAQTPSPPQPVGIPRKGSALYQLLVPPAITDGAQGLNLSAVFQHRGVRLTCLAWILNKGFWLRVHRCTNCSTNSFK